MGGILRGGVQRALDHLSHLRIRYCSWAARTIFVGQPFNAILHEPPPPFADRVLMDTKALGNFLALKPIRAQQDHPATIRQRTRRLMAADLGFEKGPILDAQYHQIRLPACHRELPAFLARASTMKLTSVPDD